MIRRGVTWLACAALVALSGPVLAQSARGTVQGRVVDRTGLAVAGADVGVVDDSTAYRTTTRSDDRGWFVVPALDPGSYRLEVGKTGFRRHNQPFTVVVGRALQLRVVLEPGPVTEVVTVTAPAAPLDRDVPAHASHTEPLKVANLPLDGRNFLELALLGAGALPPAQGSAGSVRGDFTFVVNGAREDANVFLLDGAYNVDPKLNTAAVRPPVEAIREFEVIASTPDAAFGRSAGAHVNIVTRSGANQLALIGYDFMRTGAFNARNFFAPENEPAPNYRRHQFGGAAGGAVVKDRVFFFFDYEGTRLREGITRVTNVPTEAERNGDFANSLLPAPINPFTGQPFQDNVIPDFLRHPVGLAIAALYPDPNRSEPFANFVSSPDLVDDADQFDGRLDTRAGRTTFTGRYSYSNRRLFEPFAGPGFSLVPGFGNDVPRKAHNAVLTATSTFSSTLTNEARVGWTRLSSSVNQQGQGTSLNAEVGLPDLSTDPRDFGLSFITVGGFSPIGHEFNNPQNSTVNFLQVGDTVTWMTGRHLVRFGGELRLLTQEGFRDVQSRGFLQFTNFAFTGNGLADLILGLPTVTGGALVDNPQDLQTHSYAFFVQDSIQVTPTLTFSGGVRYEFNSPPVDRNDRVTLYDPELGTIVPVGQGTMPRAGYLPDRNNLAPRLGAAWAARETTIVRGGYGVSYDQAALAPNEFLYFNSPFFDLNLFFSVPPDFFLTLSDPFPVSTFPLFVPDSATSVQRDLRTGFLHQWHIGVQQQLGDTRTLEVTYIGSRGRNLVAARDINQPAPSPAFPNLRPNPIFADITSIESRASSEYDAVQFTLDQRLSRGLSTTIAYTLGESRDDASGFFSSAGDANFPMDSNNPATEWARSNFDVRHRLAVSGLWQIPIGPDRRWLRTGVAGTCLGNWDLFFVGTFQTGRPFTVAIHPDIDNSNTGRANLGFGSNDRPDQLGDPSVGNPGPGQWFNGAAFGLPAFGTFGNVGRNSLEGPGFKNINISLTRRVPLGRNAFTIRLEVFNLFNWTNFDQPDNFFGSPTFGQILSAGAPRRLQLGLKFEY